MKVQPLEIDECFLIDHQVFLDERGYFREWFKSKDIAEIGDIFDVAQANLSFSRKNVIRGMHYSLSPFGQSKLITCISGKILDVIIDLRTDSPTFMMQEQIELTGETGYCIKIPSGVAHGFLSQSENSVVSYLLTSAYDPETEKSLNPFDRTLQIDWGKWNSEAFILSERDLSAMSFDEAKKYSLLPRIIK